MSAVTEERCGTYAEYQAHKKRGETPCADCQKANRDYVNAWRQDPTRRDHMFSLQAARNRALGRLAKAHRDEFRAMYAEESAGIVPPPRKVRVAECHPDRKHRAKGLCEPCYRKQARENKGDNR